MKNLLLLLSACCISTIAVAQFAPGKKMNGVMNMTTKTNAMGKKVNMTMQYYFSGTYLASMPNDSKEWEMVVDSLIMDGMQGKEKIYINSNQPQTMQDEKMAMLKDQVGKKVAIIIDKEGNITPKDTTEKAPEFLKYCFMPVPKTKQKVGYTWDKEEAQNASGMAMNFNSKNTITAIANNEMTIKSITNIENNMVKIDPVTTMYIADTETGLVKTATTKMKMTMMKIIKMEISTDYKATW